MLPVPWAAAAWDHDTGGDESKIGKAHLLTENPDMGAAVSTIVGIAAAMVWLVTYVTLVSCLNRYRVRGRSSPRENGSPWWFFRMFDTAQYRPEGRRLVVWIGMLALLPPCGLFILMWLTWK
jgi:hypothetical protein